MGRIHELVQIIFTFSQNLFMLTQVFASAVFGIDAVPITIEVHIDAGIGYHLVGLPDNAVKESNYRIAAALTNTNYKLPGKRITINLAPADLRKEGSAYDLPIAIGILAADGQIQPTQLESCCMMGELTLDGHLRPIKGVLPIAVQVKASGFQLAFSAVRNNKRLIGVIFGGDTGKQRDRSLKIIMDKEFSELGINKNETKTKIAKQETKIIEKNSYSIVVGTFKYQNNAKKQIKLIKNKYPKTTNNKKSNVVLIKVSGKQLYESRFENFSKKDAYAACRRLKKYKRDCFVRL